MNFPNAKRLALGTVQFGLPYGIANQTGQITGDEAAAILVAASDAGLDTLDTAIDYGESERVLGEAGVKNWSVVTKLPAIPDATTNVGKWVETQLRSSLLRLGIRQLAGVLLHRPEQLLEKRGQELYKALRAAQAAGLMRKIGISVYGPSDLDSLWPVFGAFDLVQAPLNIFDRRLISSGWLEKLHAQGVEVHTRSAFLQGLLLLNQQNRPNSFSRWQKLWQQWDQWLEENRLSALQACISFPVANKHVTKVVIGIDSVAQLQQIIAAAEHAGQPAPPEDLQSNDPQLLNPALWGQP